jgi:hypothetical protein
VTSPEAEAARARWTLRLWRWFRGLEGWQLASLAGLLAGPWFVAFRLPDFLDGTRPLTREELDGDIAAMALWYYVSLSVWASARLSPESSWWHPRGLRFWGSLMAAAEVLPDSIAFVASLPRQAWRGIRGTRARH